MQQNDDSLCGGKGHKEDIAICKDHSDIIIYWQKTVTTE